MNDTGNQCSAKDQAGGRGDVATSPIEGSSMSTTTKATKTIGHAERLTNSANGNPRFRFHWEDGGSSDLSSDAAVGYQIGNPGLRDGDTVVVSFTKAGRVAYMEPVE